MPKFADKFSKMLDELLNGSSLGRTTPPPGGARDGRSIHRTPLFSDGNEDPDHGRQKRETEGRTAVTHAMVGLVQAHTQLTYAESNLDLAEKERGLVGLRFESAALGLIEDIAAGKDRIRNQAVANELQRLSVLAAFEHQQQLDEIALVDAESELGLHLAQRKKAVAELGGEAAPALSDRRQEDYDLTPEWQAASAHSVDEARNERAREKADAAVLRAAGDDVQSDAVREQLLRNRQTELEANQAARKQKAFALVTPTGAGNGKAR